MSIDDGGPAFACPPYLHEGGLDSYWSQSGQRGMSLRAWFAGLAMQSLVATRKPGEALGLIAQSSLAMADVMIAEMKE